MNEMYGMRARRSLVASVLAMVVVATPLLLTPSRAPASWAVMITTAQDPPPAEAGLGLDRPARRVIQQGLRNEGFDPGAPDGLFGPRTRGAIRRWQEARGEPATGYLDGVQAELLRASGAPRLSVETAASATAESIASPAQVVSAAPRRSETETSANPATLTAEPSTVPDQMENCDGWNTGDFFETVTVSAVTACLAAGADVAARDDDDYD